MTGTIVWEDTKWQLLRQYFAKARRLFANTPGKICVCYSMGMGHSVIIRRDRADRPKLQGLHFGDDGTPLEEYKTAWRNFKQGYREMSWVVDTIDYSGVANYADGSSTGEPTRTYKRGFKSENGLN